jgi:hypothetical protein
MTDEYKQLTSVNKWMISFYTFIVVLIIMNPYTFNIVNWVTVKLGFPIANSNGCPNGYGLILHGIVFLLLIRLLMSINLPGVNK